jgi:hypothetical protein
MNSVEQFLRVILGKKYCCQESSIGEPEGFLARNSEGSRKPRE